MVPTAIGAVSTQQFTADGTKVVYVGPGPALFVGPADGSETPVTIVDLGGTGLLFDGFHITQDGERVVYRAGPSVSRKDIYSVFLDGSEPPVQLTQMPAQGRVLDFLLDLQGNRVVYAADELIDEVVELFSVPIDGSAPAVRISGAMVAGGDVVYDDDGDDVHEGFQISPDGSRVVYVADQLINQTQELFGVPVDGATSAVRLSRPGSQVKSDFLVDATGERVVHVALSVGATRYQVFSVAIDGSSGARQLSRASTNGYPFWPLITPDGQTVLFVSDGQLWRTPIDGMLPHIPHAAKAGRVRERVNGPLAEDAFIDTYELSPDGSRVVYRVIPESFAIDLYSVPLFDASAAVKLNGGIVASGSAHGYRILPDGARVLFKDPDGALYVVPIAGGPAPVELLASVGLFEVTADSAYVVFRAAGVPLPQLFGVATSGSQAPVQLNPHSIVSHVSSSMVAPVGRRVLYRSDHETYQLFEIHSVPADGSESSVRINAPLPEGPSNGDVQAYEVTPDGSRVVYLADQRFNSVNELFGVAIGAAPAVELSALLQGGDVREGFRLSPDASQVYFVANRELLFLLWGVAVDGSAAPFALTSNDARQVFEPFQITPDGSQAVYLSSEVAVGRVDIFSAPTDGSLESVRLDELPGGLVQGDFLITPDGERVVYRRKLLSDYDLYSAPIGLGEGDVLLGTDVQAGSGQFALTSAGARVLFGSGGLYSVLVDGSQSALQLGASGTNFSANLSGTRVAYTSGGLFSRPVDGGQPELSLDPAGRGLPAVVGGAVFYQRGGDTDEELCGVAMNGSQGPTPLTPVDAGTLTSFDISASHGRAVYVAYQEDLVLELFSVPTDGSRVATQLNAPLVAGGNVFQFQISLDGGQVVYRADQDQDEVFELFVVPIEGGTPTRLNGPLVAGGDVDSFEVGAGGRVFYLADQDTDEVNELYVSGP